MKVVAPFLAILLLSSAPARGEPVTVPLDLGVGPAAYFVSGPVADDQPLHAGLKVSLQAILDQAFMQQHQHRIPQAYRKHALRMNEVRISPSILIPDALFISPRVRNTGMYGITWRPISIGLPILDEDIVALRLTAGLLVTYAYLHSSVLPDTHFFRPGMDLGMQLEIALSAHFLVSLGWASGFYVPQGMGQFGLGPFGDTQDYHALKQTMWHFGQAFLKLHFRFPYLANL